MLSLRARARASSATLCSLTRPTHLTTPSVRPYSASKYTAPVRLRGPILAPHSFTPSQLPSPPTKKEDNSAPGRRLGDRDPNVLTLDHSRKVPERAQRQRPTERTNRRPPVDDWVPRPHTVPYKFSKKVQQWIDRHRSPLTPPQVEEVMKLVNDAPLDSVNAAVYNLVFALLGREGKFQRMWKLFNAMKKRGVRPTSRTYTTLLNAYAQVAHSDMQNTGFTPADRPAQLTLDRVRVIYEQSQQHIKRELQRAQPEDTGLDLPQDGPEDVDEVQVNIRPTNAYLKFLGRFGMWEEMQEVFLGMDPVGPLSPDQVTYTTLFHAINNIDHHRRSMAKSKSDTAVRLPDVQTGPTARLLWDQAVRGLTSPKREPGCELDENVALIALQCFVAGRPEDARLVETLIPQLWGLAAPGKPGVASAAPPQADATSNVLPRFKLTVRHATALMSLLARMQRSSLAAHYTHLILDTERLQQGFDLPLLRVAVHNLCAMHDVEAAVNVLDMYSPGTGKDGWPLDVLHAVLSAARWSKDWDAALDVFRRFTFLPPDVENGAPEGRYEWTSPNGRPTDVRGKKWVRPAPKRPDVRALDLLVRAALATSNLKPMRQALSIWAHTGPWYAATVDGQALDLRHPPERVAMTQALRRQIGDLVEMARSVQSAAERVLEKPKDDAEKAAVSAILEDTRAFLKSWAGKDLKSAAPRDGAGKRPDARSKPARGEGGAGFSRGERRHSERPRRDWSETRSDRPKRDWDETRSNRPRREWDQQRSERPRREWDGTRSDRPRRDWDQQRSERPRREWDQQRSERPRRNWDERSSGGAKQPWEQRGSRDGRRRGDEGDL